MGLESTLENFKNTLISNISYVTVHNCKIHDESVFNYQKITDGVDSCFVISADPFNEVGNSEFRSQMFRWGINVSGFFAISMDDIATPSANAVKFIDDVVDTVISNNTLGGTAMSAKVVRGGPLLSLQRVDVYYIIAPVDVVILENVT